MTFETVLYELKDGVATVTMNRSDALNALSLQLTVDLDRAFRKATCGQQPPFPVAAPLPAHPRSPSDRISYPDTLVFRARLAPQPAGTYDRTR